MPTSIVEDFTIQRLDMNNLPPELFTFMEKAKEQQMMNNVSLAAMKMGKWGENEAWWVVWADNQIISISGCHHLNVLEEGCWRLMLRAATLREYRGRAPGAIKNLCNDFNFGHIRHYQTPYARSQGAKRVVFTTNSDQHGDPKSFRTNRAVSGGMVKSGVIRLYAKDVEIYSTKQNVWEIL